MNINRMLFPIEFYMQKKVFVYLLIINAIFLPYIFFNFLFEYAFNLKDIEWFFLTWFFIVTSVVILFFTFKKSFNKQPDVIVEKDRIYLLNVFTGNYQEIEFDNVQDIKLIYIGNAYSLSLFDRGGTKPLFSDATWQYRWRACRVNGQELDSFQSFDIIWQVFWNYHEETNYPLRIRQKEEWDWWE